VDAAGRWRLLEGDVEVVPGISVRVTPGHVPWHQVVLVRDRGETTAFVGDLLATASHLPLPYIMGYDLEPLRTLESKRSFLRDALAGSWRVVFEHDAKVAWGWLTPQGKGLGLRDAEAAG
jgi:glyoxylase-like metal-dependent hydrolase (beta-lactamase superfamily II)